MTVSSQLLHRITDPTLPSRERAQLRCQLAKQLEDVGNYDAAREAMGELWAQVGERPVLAGLDESTAGEVLLRVGVLTGWLGSVKQIEGAHETARNLISESLASFETLQDKRKIAEAQMELGHCYWRDGEFDEARVWLKEALDRVPDDAREFKAITLSRLATVERAAKRVNDAYQLLTVAAPLVNAGDNNSLKGKFYNQFATVLENIGRAENTKDYIDRALIEYAAASYYFELAGHTRYQGCVENNLGFLFSTITKFTEAHEHLDRSQALFTSIKDTARIAGVDETRAKVLLAEGRVSEAEKLVRMAVQVLEKGSQQSLLAEALTTHGLILARLGRHKIARLTLQRAVEVAQNAGDSETAGLASLIILEELAEHLPENDLNATYDRAAELLAKSENRESKDRLLACSRRVLFLISSLPSPPTWKSFNFMEAVRRYEARIIERALKDAGGVVTRAAQLLGIERQSLDAMLRKGRHRARASLRTPVEPRLDTSVVELTDLLADPVEVLFGTQLGGGTDINRALSYCQGLVRAPRDTILVLVSDLYEGGNQQELLKRAASIVATGAQLITLLSLDDRGAPSYDHHTAARFSALGIPCFACTPDLFPEMMAAAISRRDLSQWAAANGVVTTRPSGAATPGADS